MKIRFSSFIALLIITGLFSCNKYDFDYPPGTVAGSKIIYFADIALVGPQYESVVVGGTWVDQGAVATSNGAPLPVTTTGTVDTNEPGVYVISYAAYNAEGYPATTSRTVMVLPAAPDPGVDISGTYFYIATPSATAKITMVAPGFYTSGNCWSAATTIPCLFYSLNGKDIVMPNQTTGFGELFGTATLDASGALTYTVSIPSQGINGTLRKWHAQ